MAAGAFYSDPTLDLLTANGTEFGIDAEQSATSPSRRRPIISTRNRAPPASPATTAWAATTIPIAILRSPIPTSQRRGNYGFYLTAEQMVFREGGPSSRQGLSVYGSFIYAPSQRINAIPYFAAMALGYQGLLPRRDNDLAAIAVYYGAFSRYLPGQTLRGGAGMDVRARRHPMAHHPAGSSSTSSTRAASRACAMRSWWECSCRSSSSRGLLLPQPTQAHGGAELPGFGRLAARHGEGLLQALFRLRCIRNSAARARASVAGAAHGLDRTRRARARPASRAAPRRVLCTRCRGVGAQAAAGLTAAPRSRLARAPVQA